MTALRPDASIYEQVQRWMAAFHRRQSDNRRTSLTASLAILLISLVLIANWKVAMAGQTISALTDADLERLEEQRAVVTQFLDDEGLEKFKEPPGKLGTLRAILEASIFSPEQTYELQCMGIVLGDVFVQHMGFHWIIVEDEYGRDPAIRYQETSVILFPLTMLSKRIEQGETVDVFELYGGIAALAQEQIDSEDVL